MPRQYISKVKAPTGGIYYIKDDEARAQIAQIGNFSRYLGVATDMPTNTSVTVKYIGDTGEETITYTTTSEEPYKLSSGDVVTVSNTTTEPYGEKEYIFNGTGWAELNTVQGLLKAFAYVSVGYGIIPDYVKTGTVTVSSANLAATAVPATFSTTAVTGATAIKTLSSVKTRSDVITGGKYDKTTSATVTIDSSATFSGTVSSVVTDVTQTKNYLVANVGQSIWLTGVSYSKATGGTVAVNASASFSGTVPSVVTDVIPSISSYRVSVPKDIWVTGVSYSKTTTATASGTSLSVSTSTIYGANSALKVMTGPESLDKKTATPIDSISTTTLSAVIASMDGETEILSFNYVNPLSAITTTSVNVLSSTTDIIAGTSSTLGSKTFVTDVSVSAEPTITLSWGKTAATLTKVPSSYMDIVASSTGMSLVSGISVTKSDIDFTVTGSAVTDPTVTITNTKTAADLTKNAATTIPVISATSGSYSVVTNISPTISDVDVTVSGSAVTTSDVSLSYTSTPIDTSGYTATVVSSITTSTMYGKVSAYAGGSHTHEISDTITITQSGTTTISVYPGEHP